jgi:hypothetical protein
MHALKAWDKTTQHSKHNFPQHRILPVAVEHDRPEIGGCGMQCENFQLHDVLLFLCPRLRCIIVTVQAGRLRTRGFGFRRNEHAKYHMSAKLHAICDVHSKHMKVNPENTYSGEASDWSPDDSTAQTLLKAHAVSEHSSNSRSVLARM